jgi:ParB family chromosome partitioning protein
VRYVALRSLGLIGDRRAAPAVLERLRDDTAPHVRLAAMDVVGRLTPPGALEILEPFTASEDRDMARAAIRGIGHVGNAEALSCLERFLHVPETWRRLEGVSAIASRSEPRVAQLLQWTAAADDHPEVSAAAIDALARIGAREDAQGVAATRALVALAAERDVREAVVAALATLPHRLVGEIAGGLRHPVVEVRRACVEALGRMKRPEASRALEEALSDAMPAVRLTAIAELRHLGTRAPERALINLARADPDAAVRRAAMQAMARRDGVDTAEAG